MAQAKILSVCGSGTITSSMVSNKLRENLKERGYDVTCTESKPTDALSTAQMGNFDVIVHTSTLPAGDYPCPTISSFPCITGMGEQEFFDQVAATLKELGK